MLQNKSKHDKYYWIFTLPGFLIFTLVVMIPFIIGIRYSFFSWNGISKTKIFVGFTNYLNLFTNDEGAINSLTFTFKYTFTVVILSNLIGLILALLIVKIPNFKGLFRVIFFLPNVIGGLILGFIWRFLLINALPVIGNFLHINAISYPWLGDLTSSYWGTVIVYVWKTTGYLMVIYIASLLTIDKNILEAANIDGATNSTVFLKIKLPLIMPAITICIFLMLSWAFKLFDVIFSLTNGGPFGSTEAFALNIYNEAFKFNNYGYASAKSVLFFILVALISVFQVRFTKKREVSL
ncbi:MAG: sugar ABC transporter permease [Sphaerochaetaceae bacterium]|nr:sugar ABC transporter permease [Sphaerochaetaceae bacterium]